MSKLHRISSDSVKERGALIFVHGLGGDPYATWSSGPRSEDFWPSWIPQELPDLDVWTIEYEASPSTWHGSAMALPDRAANLSAWFESEGLQDQRLVFVTHSLGGLVAKQLLRLAADRPGTPLGRILTSTQGVVFLGTPNTGSDLANWMDRLRTVLGASAATKDLQADSPYLRELNGWYRERAPAADIATLVFAETRATKGLMVVEQASADPGIPGVLPIPVDADHLSIVKLQSHDELVYKRIKRFVEERLPASSPRSIPTRKDTDSRRFFISYRHRANDDAKLARRLHEGLTEAGHEIFIDVQMPIGAEWARLIADRIDWCDFLIVLLSAESIESEMVQQEVRLAHQRRKRDGTPIILPVRIRYEGELGYAIGSYVEPYQYFLWKGDQDTDALVAQILKVTAIESATTAQTDIGEGSQIPSAGVTLRPAAAADPRLLRHPSGVISIDDPTYIQRAADRRILTDAALEGVTLVIRAPRQSGKTSLLIRYLAHCKEKGKRIAAIDFQIFTKAQLDDLAICLSRIAKTILRDLAVDPSLNRTINAPDELTDFLEDVVFTKISEPIAIGFDEADRLIASPWHNDFFAMLRHWHNLRGMRPQRGWSRFDLALVAATEPSLLINDAMQSPFNVGEPVRLGPFDRNDLAQLNHAYGNPLDNASLTKLEELVGGQPYLSRMAFFVLATQSNISFLDLLSRATTHDGPFGDHLKARFSMLAQYPDLADAFRMLLNRDTQPKASIGFRLEALGLVRKNVDNRFVPMNQLYATYFSRIL